jgi:hypothetical protein
MRILFFYQIILRKKVLCWKFFYKTTELNNILCGIYGPYILVREERKGEYFVVNETKL